MILFSLWIGISTFALATEFVSWTFAPQTAMWFFFAIFGFLGLDQVRFADDRRCNRTAYGITEHRVIVMDGRKKSPSLSLPLMRLHNLSFFERRDRVGTIKCTAHGTSLYKKNRRQEIVPRPLFRYVVDVRFVHALLLEAQQNAILRTEKKD